MQFINAAQELTYERVKDYLNNSQFKDTMEASEQRPYFALSYQGTTPIELYILPWETHPYPDQAMAIVRASSCVATGCGPELELLRFLLDENRKMRFGSFQTDEAGTVFFANRILGGQHMDPTELEVCLLSVGAIATRYSTMIIDKFGGQRGPNATPTS
ncbi:T3SS (YopN, CesT) and YbjN peptide-binding chaperone 1 [Leptothoe kymatousa]|uniref:TY-Chap central domain-containing protein n=1 Tax=Leptothoe kymatousa TAU-MAC 1615 TaxID=2364775 RepID=A0ABS5Y1P7_9CYAN|nr:YbjN domain-containing protein [Leptothoe kymatousa]MBT9311521.1 hypothetical protein [Leptothoe kymatousa TAU-MAC 1615]